MNILIFASALFCLSQTSFSQSVWDDDSAEQTLFDAEYESGGYGAIEWKYAQYKGEAGNMLGFRGGWIIDHKLSVGGGGFIMLTPFEIERYKPKGGFAKNYDSTVVFRCGWGGLFVEYIHMSDEVIHFTANALFAVGGGAYTSKLDEIRNNDSENLSSTWSYETSTFFAFEPGATVDVNVFKFMRFTAGVNYRIIKGLDLKHTKSSDLSGFSFSIGLKFGKF